jgi:GNAT superfamily N-acetyltransferase
MCSTVNYHVVTKENQHLHLQGFIDVYKKAFGGAPYFEVYTNDQVEEEVFKPHLDHGIIVVACIDNTTIGLSCAIPFGMAPEEDQLFLEERIKDGSFSHDTENLWYMSELAVLEEHRKNGIGSELITKRLECILERGHNMYCMGPIQREFI